jgi:glycosyltransferase involved in cell wall biosynthesis
MTNSSGGTKFIFNLVNELSKYHNVVLYLQKPPTVFNEEFKRSGIKVISMSNCSTGDLKFWLRFSSQINKQKLFLKKEAVMFDVVISMIFPMNILGNSINLPHLQHCFQPFGYFWDRILIKKLPIFQRIFLFIMRKLYGKLDILYTQKSDLISTPTKEVSDYVKEFYGKDSIPVSAGVDSIFKPTIDEELAEKYKNNKILIHSTDWTFTKNTNWLIDQFLEISKQIKNIKLLITEVKSAGSERDLALEKIKKYDLDVDLCGLIPEKLLPSYYSIADVGVYPGVAFKNSAASLWVLECMACRTPVVRTNNTNSEVKHGESGFLFDIEKPRDFQNYVITLLTNDKLRDEFGQNATEFISDHRSWSKITNLFEENCLCAIRLHKSSDC